MGSSGWSGNFGQSRQVPCSPFLTAEGGGAGAIGLVQIESAGDEPRPIAVTLVAPRDIEVTPKAELVAVVQWGIAGADVTALVDFINGQVLNLIARYVRVSVVQQMMRVDAIPGIGVVQPTVGAFACPGWLPQARCPQRTVGTNDPIIVGSDKAIEIPAFAKSFRLICMPATTKVKVQIFSDAMKTCQIADYPVTSYPSADLPVPNGIEHVYSSLGYSVPLMWMHNDNGAGGAAIDRYRMVFDLML